MRRSIRFLVLSTMAILALCGTVFIIPIRNGVDIEMSLAPKVYHLGEPIELTVIVDNGFPVRLLSGSWIEGSEYCCEQMTWAPGVDFSLYSGSREPLSYKPRLPYEGYVRLRIQPGEVLRASCDLTEVFNLSQPGTYRAAAVISGEAFLFDDTSWRRLYKNSVASALADLSEQIVSEFEVRRLSPAEFGAVRDRASTGEIAAIRILGAHQDTGAVEALDQVWALPQLGVRREAARTLAEIPGRDATDALGHGLVLETNPELKEEMARLMESKRHGLGAEPWIRELAQDTVVFHETKLDGIKYRVYRLRALAKDYFERLGKPIDVEFMVTQ